ncbi:acyl-protein thioesterase 1,2 [Achlya hypogyna]|uniref:Acyl-protein thioesterase 1,2 n=1 Tax=Achlya hypogyna TaxID=1202772 RepID=A0A1V9YA82_ACHHY|nr:acyl-protein thioesterase 1,2 [Achlya hypogyna]
MGNVCQAFGYDLPVPDDNEWDRRLILHPQESHVATVIWLHGLGDTGNSWQRHVTELGPLSGVKYIFPTAPTRRVTLNGGMLMPAWYDIFGLAPQDREDEEGIQHAANVLAKIIQSEIAAGIPPTKIAVVGFSQGAAIAMHTVYRLLTFPIACGVFLSGYLPMASSFHARSPTTPGLQCHGEKDPLIPVVFGQKSNDILAANAISVKFATFPKLAHGVNSAELLQVHAFLASHLALL